MVKPSQSIYPFYQTPLAYTLESNPQSRMGLQCMTINSDTISNNRTAQRHSDLLTSNSPFQGQLHRLEPVLQPLLLFTDIFKNPSFLRQTVFQKVSCHHVFLPSSCPRIPVFHCCRYLVFPYKSKLLNRHVAHRN